MLMSKVKYFLQCLNTTVYLAMLVLGYYFIDQGKVIQKFRDRRTNFAVSEEGITELPTIITYISHPIKGKGIHFPKDFTMQFRILTGALFMGNLNQKNLHVGENVIQGTSDTRNKSLNVHVEKYPRHSDWYRISPANFTKGMPLNYIITYKFTKSENICKD